MFKGSKPPIEGIIEEETRGRVVLLYQGRRLVIPRSRIEFIERDEDGAQLPSLIEKAREALGNEDLDKAEEHLPNAKVLDEEDRQFARRNALLLEKVGRVESVTALNPDEEAPPSATALLGNMRLPCSVWD